VRGSDSLEPSLSRAHELLGVPTHADAAQLARAYRRQARRLHPDLSAEPDATERFWALQAAYRVALDAAQSGVPPTPAQIAPHASTVVLSVPTEPGLLTNGVSAHVWPGRRHVAWLAAGPVHVQPPQRPTRGTTDSEEGP
jgi:hypothetical protein